MPCPECDETTVVGSVPAALREYAPADRVAVCTACLSVTATDGATPSADEEGGSGPDVGQISGALPADEVGALAVVMAADLLSSLATNRPAIEALLEAAERRGVDPVLALQRLAADPTVSPAADLERRLDQIEGFRR